MSDEAKEEKKIIVDEDWKSQVEAEKEVLEGSKEETQQQAPADADVPLPPPTLALLATTVATQAMMSMGAIPNPTTGKSEVHLNQAKHLIDTVQMLQEKTEGNRAAEESSLLESLLHELRMVYVSVSKQSSGSAENQ